MKVILVHEFGGPEVLKLEEVATPKPSAGEVLVRIMGPGLIPMTPTCARAPMP
jgi:NADPH:quinone reductase-like Zn-dependent oxidoreductase